jgi:hypothetical protein
VIEKKKKQNYPGYRKVTVDRLERKRSGCQDNSNIPLITRLDYSLSYSSAENDDRRDFQIPSLDMI